MYVEKITISDYELLKNNNFNLLIQKYTPLIISSSKEHYNILKSDKAIEFQDVIQNNIMSAWRTILSTLKSMEKNETKFNKKMHIGLLLKRNFKLMKKGLYERQKLKIHRNLISINTNMQDHEVSFIDSYYLTCPINVENEYEKERLKSEFTKLLSKKELEILSYLEQKKDCVQIAKKLNLSVYECRKIRTQIKKKCYEFIKQQGYTIRKI